MLRGPVLGILSLVAVQPVANAQDQSDLRTSLQGRLNEAMTAGNFDKARMGERGTRSDTYHSIIVIWAGTLH